MTTSSAPGRSKAGEQRGVRTIAGIIIAACLMFWMFVFSDSGWGPILTPLAAHLHVSLVIVGLFYVSWSTGYLPGALVGGAMLDRYGPRRVFFAAALIIFAGLLCIFLGLLLPNAPTPLAMSPTPLVMSAPLPPLRSIPPFRSTYTPFPAP